ncbi:CRISPR-associated protein Cas1 [Candidatus Termititenax dinenymphae]|uniref:CRISPR-associated endonuclease Cas1 n=1 Tax=Candidatus Termititenax dinenymphae TaxID=2218523 RepID=A0A388TLY6_9BACT|nr:CRISPR-associated protein Cas1 [Candidatus Termititenax dinenymphae]
MLSLPDFKEKQIVMCFCNEGQKMLFRNDNMIVADIDGKIIVQITCYKIFALFVAGSTSITTGILERSKKFRFPIVFMSYSLRVTGVWTNGVDGNFLLRQKQYEYKDLSIARYLVQNKIYNQLQLIKTIRDKDQKIKSAVENLKNYCGDPANINNLDQLLGCEGLASRVYFKAWFGERWQMRRPRTKIDTINTCLDIGYTILFNIIDAMLSVYGFDLYKGVYHREFYQRKSLVCDLVEPFRVIIDKALKKAFNLGQIKDEFFKIEDARYILRSEHSKDLSKIFMSAILEYKEDIFLYMQKYYRAFMQGRDLSEYPVFVFKGED